MKTFAGVGRNRKSKRLKNYQMCGDQWSVNWRDLGMLLTGIDIED